jgi:hypothetical protein
VSNLVQWFNPNKSITSSLYLSCVKLFATVSIRLNQSTLRPLITRQTWCNFSIRINQSPPPSIYHVSNFSQGVSIRLNQSTLPSVNHASNLVQFFNPTQSITFSSLYLSCVKVGSGPNGSLGRIIYHFFPVRHTPSLSQPRLSTQDFYVSCFSYLLYLLKFFNFHIDFSYICGRHSLNQDSPHKIFM